MKDFFKKNLIAGLLILIPLGLTYFLFAILIQGLDTLMAPWIRRFILWSGAPMPEDFHLPGLGFMLTCLALFLVGVFATNFFGRQIVDWGDRILHNIPLVRVIYSTFKKVVDSISDVDTKAFEKMALVRYPHLSTHVMGLVACNGRGEVVSRTRDNLVNVFVPMLPNVTLGWFLVVPREQVMVLDMSREAGIKMLLSFGMVEGKSGPAAKGAPSPS